MIAARMPAVRKPPNTGPASFFTINGSRIFGFACTGGGTLIRSLVAQMPISTQGTHTIMMNTGCATTGNLKLLALFAVSQCWNKCGNIPTENGTNI